MYNSFWWDANINPFLFNGWTIKTVGGLTCTCLGLSICAIVFEWLKLLQARQRQKELYLRAKQIRSICPITEDVSLLGGNRQGNEAINITLMDRAMLVFCDAFLWLNLQLLGYLLMLTVMIYNAWLLIAVTMGSGFGFFVFGPQFMKINLQNCQVIRDTFCMRNCGEPDPHCHDGESTPALQASSSADSISQFQNQDGEITAVSQKSSGVDTHENIDVLVHSCGAK